jgi:hypothetical protein
MLTEHDMDKLQLQRRLSGPCLSVKNVLEHEALIDSSLQRWLRRLKKVVDEPVDFTHECELLAIDLLSELALAEPYGAIEAGTDNEHMKHLSWVWRHWAWVGYLPLFIELDKVYLGLRKKSGLLQLPVLGVGPLNS